MRSRRSVARMRKDAGFALLEVLVALAILSVGLVAVLTALRSSSYLVETSARTFVGIVLAEEMLGAHASGVVNVPLDPGTAAGYTSRVTAASPVDMDPILLIGPLMAKKDEDGPGVDPIGNLELVEASVSWEQRGRTQSVVLQELVLRPVEEASP